MFYTKTYTSSQTIINIFPKTLTFIDTFCRDPVGAWSCSYLDHQLCFDWCFQCRLALISIGLTHWPSHLTLWSVKTSSMDSCIEARLPLFQSIAYRVFTKVFPHHFWTFQPWTPTGVDDSDIQKSPTYVFKGTRRILISHPDVVIMKRYPATVITVGFVPQATWKQPTTEFGWKVP